MSNLKNIIVGDFLRMRRESLKLTRSDLSKRLNVRSQYIANWERGQCLPPKKLVPKLIKALEMNSKQLIKIYLRGDEALYLTFFNG